MISEIFFRIVFPIHESDHFEFLDHNIKVLKYYFREFFGFYFLEASLYTCVFVYIVKIPNLVTKSFLKIMI